MQEEAKCNRTKGTYLYFFTIKYSRKPTLNKTISAVVNNITKYKTYIYTYYIFRGRQLPTYLPIRNLLKLKYFWCKN